MVTFGMAITLSEAQLELCDTLMRPAWIALGLQNDFYSWDKEARSARDHGRACVVNAVWVLMQEYSVTESEAKRMCKEKIREVVAEYNCTVEEYRNKPELSCDMRRYLEALRYSLSGNAVWSLTCPRYHAGSTYSERQIAMMERNAVCELDNTYRAPSELFLDMTAIA